jgi:hypothetical protein
VSFSQTSEKSIKEFEHLIICQLVCLAPDAVFKDLLLHFTAGVVSNLNPDVYRKCVLR